MKFAFCSPIFSGSRLCIASTLRMLVKSTFHHYNSFLPIWPISVIFVGLVKCLCLKEKQQGIVLKYFALFMQNINMTLMTYCCPEYLTELSPLEKITILYFFLQK